MDALAQSQIELNKIRQTVNNHSLSIEIVAASIGLFIGKGAISSISYYESLEGSDALIGSTFTTFIGAVYYNNSSVELTKIPLALGFYRTKRLFGVLCSL